MTFRTREANSWVARFYVISLHIARSPQSGPSTNPFETSGELRKSGWFGRSDFCRTGSLTKSPQECLGWRRGRRRLLPSERADCGATSVEEMDLMVDIFFQRLDGYMYETDCQLSFQTAKFIGTTSNRPIVPIVLSSSKSRCKLLTQCETSHTMEPLKAWPPRRRPQSV